MKKYLVYGLQAVLVLFFIAPGVMKLIGNPALVEVFVRFGYPLWFMYFIGAAEVAGALGIAFGGYINKRLPQLAVLGLIILMIGAVGSHIMAGDPITAAVPAVINLVLLALYMHILKKRPTQAATVQAPTPE